MSHVDDALPDFKDEAHDICDPVWDNGGAEASLRRMFADGIRWTIHNLKRFREHELRRLADDIETGNKNDPSL